MIYSRLLGALSAALTLQGAAASFSHSSGLDVTYHARNAPGSSSEDTLRAVGRALTGARLSARDNQVYTQNTTLQKSWDGIVLFAKTEGGDKGGVKTSAGVAIICKKCYMTANTSVQFSITDGYNISSAFQTILNETESDIQNITTAVENGLKTVVTDLKTEFETEGLHFSNWSLPPVNVSFDFTVPVIPECLLQFEFDNLELYVETDKVFSSGATYTLNLFTSETPLGFSLGNGAQVGVILSLDLILSVNGKVDISSGFHIKMNDGLAIKIPMFSQNASNIVFNGGKFEFLPVQVETSGVILDAKLRLGMHSGVNAATPPLFDFDVVGLQEELSASAGIQASVWANIAELTTNITVPPPGSGATCDIIIEETYQMGLGAGAGATVALATHTWGPHPSAVTTIYQTTLNSVCGTAKAVTLAGNASTSSSSPGLAGREPQATTDASGLTTTTLTSVMTYMATSCLAQIPDCPQSSQTTTKVTTTSTWVTAVTSGANATFPAPQATVTSTVGFGNGVKAIGPSSGAPTSYNPATYPTTAADDPDSLPDDSWKVGVGVGVGLGGALLASVLGLAYCVWARKRAIVKAKEARKRKITLVKQQGPDSDFDGQGTFGAGALGMRQKLGASIMGANYGYDSLSSVNSGPLISPGLPPRASRHFHFPFQSGQNTPTHADYQHPYAAEAQEQQQQRPPQPQTPQVIVTNAADDESDDEEQLKPYKDWQGREYHHDLSSLGGYPQAADKHRGVSATYIVEPQPI